METGNYRLDISEQKKVVYIVEVSKRISFLSVGVEHFAQPFLNQGVGWHDSEQLDVPTTHGRPPSHK